MTDSCEFSFGNKANDESDGWKPTDFFEGS